MFTDDEIQVLMDALDAWEEKEATDEMLATMLTFAMATDAADAANIMRERKAKKAPVQDSRRLRKERSVLLKAKLIQLRDKLLVANEMSL